MDKVYFVSGIDTGIGKSYATGYLAKQLNDSGVKTITQKLVQTGNTDFSEDIALHRVIMGIQPTEEDEEGLTMPEIFLYPASPHLAAKLEGRRLDLEKIQRATEILCERYDRVLLEGAGGIMVPLTRDLLTIDYIAQKHYPLMLVTCGRLGSINHTLLTLEAVRRRGIRLIKLLYNEFPVPEDKTIQDDTRNFLEEYLKRNFQEAEFQTVPEIRLP